MIKIRPATIEDTDIIMFLGEKTYTESHGQFIADKEDLIAYNKTAFSKAKIQEDLYDPNNLFYILYVEDIAVGYAKLVLNIQHETITSEQNCKLERIYILAEYIPRKLGQQFLSFLEKEAKALNLDTMWLSVYIKNKRAIRFYQKNEFKNVGTLSFIANGKAYENIVFSKAI